MNFDETQMKIMNGAMELIMERGYTAATTKDIARAAGVNECTIFRRFRSKKDIVLSAMTLPQWNPGLRREDFTWRGDVTEDLTMFARVYMEKVTPQMVKVSMGLRSPELFEDTAEGILAVPKLCKEALLSYFRQMEQRGQLAEAEPENLAMAFLSMCFGFVFLKGSFGDDLTELADDDYIRQSVRVFVRGIGGR